MTIKTEFRKPSISHKHIISVIFIYVRHIFRLRFIFSSEPKQQNNTVTIYLHLVTPGYIFTIINLKHISVVLFIFWQIIRNSGYLIAIPKR
ncbi:hypothetical protein HanRHA438_Chr10g0434561 [Helianthus annuus]|nr:hypothetical protein HanRHA438_Chr10g0434561 [Helianthus annuus]